MYCLESVHTKVNFKGSKEHIVVKSDLVTVKLIKMQKKKQIHSDVQGLRIYNIKKLTWNLKPR